MTFFSLNAFYLGAIMFLAFATANILFVMLCVIWRIKFVEFGVFSNPWFSIYSKSVMGIKFILGWLPLGCHLKPLGALKEDIDEGKIQFEDLAYTFQSKSILKQKIFRISPWLVWLLVLVLCLFFLDTSNSFINNFQVCGDYMVKVFHALFSDKTYKPEFLSFTKYLLTNKSVVPLSTIFFIVYFILLSVLFKVSGWMLVNNLKKYQGIMKFLGILLYLFLTFMFLLKIPYFIFNNISFLKFLKYLFSTTIGLYTSGFTFYFLIVFLVRRNIIKLNSF